MSRRISLNMRRMMDAASTDEVEVVLLSFTHPSLDRPVRLSTDNADRISRDPLVYGTRSTWDGADPDADPYLFVVADAVLPGDLEDGPTPAHLVLDNLDASIAEILQSFTDYASVRMAVVFASAPNEIVAEFHELTLISATGTASEITLQISRLPIEDETVPMERFTKNRFPGLFR